MESYERRTSDERLVRLEAAIESMVKAVDKNERNQDNLVSKIDRLVEKLSTADGVSNSLVEKIAMLHGEVGKLRHDCANALNGMKGIEIVDKKVETNKGAIAVLDAKVDDLMRYKERHTAEAQEGMKTLTTNAADIKAIQDQIAKINLWMTGKDGVTATWGKVGGLAMWAVGLVGGALVWLLLTYLDARYGIKVD